MIHEILDSISKQTDKNQKINIIRQNNTPALREIFKYAFTPQLKFFTDGVPNYKKDNPPEGMSFNSLYNEYRRFYILTDPIIEQQICGKTTTPKRKNEILIQILENIHPNEADVLASMVRGDFAKKYNITKKLIEEALPNLFKK